MKYMLMDDKLITSCTVPIGTIHGNGGYQSARRPEAPLIEVLSYYLLFVESLNPFQELFPADKPVFVYVNLLHNFSEELLSYVRRELVVHLSFFITCENIINIWRDIELKTDQ